MKYWLLKTEPSTYSWDDLCREPLQTGRWDGVRNYQARNNLRAMKLGDRCFFYHSREEPLAIVGIVEIVREGFTDPLQFDEKSEYFDAKSTPSNPRWTSVSVRAKDAFQPPVTMSELRKEPRLSDMVLLNNTRLSVQPLTADEWRIILGMRNKR